MPVTIIGGGPCGLYLAWKLADEDIKSIVIDPRMGEYYRLGHLNASVFGVIRNDVPDSFFGQWNQARHIKDLERLLHGMAATKPHKIKLVKGTFIGFKKSDNNKHAIIYKTPENDIVQIVTDTVFDCTGRKRAVLQSTSNVLPDISWPVKSLHAPVFPSTLLYYCRIDSHTLSLLKPFGMYDGAYHLLEGEKLMAMQQDLEQFGWYHGSFPTLYEYTFGNKNKNAIYCSAPAELKPSQYHTWVSTLVAYKTGNHDCKIEFIPSENTIKHKLRQMHFFINYERLIKSGRTKDSVLPNILALGDAQIGFDYRRAHGVEDSLVRIQQLMKFVEEYEGNLEFFDLERYLDTIKTSLNQHEKILTDSYNDDVSRCMAGYEKLLKTTVEKFGFGLFDRNYERLTSNATYALVCLKSAKTVDQLKIKLKNKTLTYEMIEAAFSDPLLPLTFALKFLPKQYKLEHELGQKALSALFNELKNTANQYFKARDFSFAVGLYELGAHHANFVKCVDMAYVYYSNAVIAYKELKQPDNIAATCKQCLHNLPNTPSYPLRGKVVYNLISSAAQYPEHETLMQVAKTYVEDSSVLKLPRQKQEDIRRLRDELFATHKENKTSIYKIP